MNGVVLKPVLHVEAVQRLESNLDPVELSTLIQQELNLLGQSKLISTRTSINIDHCRNEHIKHHVESITLCELNNVDTQVDVDLREVELQCHVYRLLPDGPQIEVMEGESDENVLSAANHWILPSRDLDGLWENLIYDSVIKDNRLRLLYQDDIGGSTSSTRTCAKLDKGGVSSEILQLLSFVETTLLFSERSVDSNVICWNRVVLLHGPPGTGKTSLCKALAQKLTIRLCNEKHFTHGELIEINSHSLFSKWFSESGKLVMKMFSKIHELVDDPKALVCILIDEVESLAHARQSSAAGTEPSDSIRVVNAVLTQIDQLRRYPNVLILTTSNLTGAIDLAFVDRADIKQYIGLPSVPAIYQIYSSCIQELVKKNIISPSRTLLDHRALLSGNNTTNVEVNGPSYTLLNIARKSEGLSGRTLRKIPFLAHAHYVKRPSVSLEDFLCAMEKAVAKQLLDRKQLEIEGK